MISITAEQYYEWLSQPVGTILNDPGNHDCENKNYDHYYLENVYAKTKYGIVVLEAGRVVNGASIPWLAQCIIPKSGKWNRCAGFHDVGYEDGGLWILQPDGSLKFRKLRQKQVDELYLDLMAGREVPRWNRYTQYSALRLGGWVAWNKYRRKDKKKAARR